VLVQVLALLRPKLLEDFGLGGCVADPDLPDGLGTCSVSEEHRRDAAAVHHLFVFNEEYQYCDTSVAVLIAEQAGQARLVADAAR